MLRRSSVRSLRAGLLRRSDSYVVITMRHYPRGASRLLRDEYVRALAPSAELFADFKAHERASGDHDGAFDHVEYERRFGLSADGLRELARLVALARTREVALVCQCKAEERCHVDLVLLMARALHDVPTGEPAARYEVFRERLRRGDV